MAQLTKKWLDKLEETLTAEAALAGLFDHGTMTGSAREFFIRRVLRTILPPSVHIGTGRIVGVNDELSIQARARRGGVPTVYAPARQPTSLPASKPRWRGDAKHFTNAAGGVAL